MELLRLGDVIVPKLKYSDPLARALERLLRMRLDRPEAVECGRTLVASGRWRKVVREPEKAVRDAIT